MAKFFEFDQNNSGGWFVGGKMKDILTHIVIVEADDYNDANDRATRLGIYFDGCSDGKDCPCCGDRWYELSSYDEGTDLPMHCGTPIEGGTTEIGPWMKDFEAVVVYKDGRVDRYKLVRFDNHTKTGSFGSYEVKDYRYEKLPDETPPQN